MALFVKKCFYYDSNLNSHTIFLIMKLYYKYILALFISTGWEWITFTVKGTFLTAVSVEFVTFNTCWNSTYPVFRVNVILQLTLNCKVTVNCW